MTQPDIKIVECPRDAMQGIATFIPTETKVRYLNKLLKVGFHTLDFGSFVSPKAVPQLADTAEVLAGLDLDNTATRLLAIVANRRGAETAAALPEIHDLGYPFSISETFQLRNTNKTIAESLALVEEMKNLADDTGKELVIYLSMGFGNPYGDPWSPALAQKWVAEMATLGIRHIALADTVGSADPATIKALFETLIPRFEEIEFGAHFHAHPNEREAKVEAAWLAGCRRFDSALRGFGGCPFAEDELVGNIATESLLLFCEKHGIHTGLDTPALNEALNEAGHVFSPIL